MIFACDSERVLVKKEYMDENEVAVWRKSYQDVKTRISPVMLLDTKVAVNNTKLLKSLLPRVDIYYAVKSFSDRNLIKALEKHVTGYDVASIGEVQKLLKCGIDSSRMLFSNPVKIPGHIKSAYKLGIKDFAFDSVEEINKLAKYAPGSNVYLRILVSDYGSKFPLSKKFGVDPNHATTYASMAIEKGLNFVGITFHVGSQSESPVAWKSALEVAGTTIDSLQKVGIKVKLLNLGGGFPATYTDPVISVEDIAAEINDGLKRHVPKNIKIVAEPGRFISASAAVIISTVIGKEQRAGRQWLYLDIGAFQGLIEPLETPELKYPVVNLDSKDPMSSATFVLTGPTCDAQDTLGLEYKLPSNTKTGDRLLIGVVGAYSLSYASYFNGFRPPKVIHLN